MFDFFKRKKKAPEEQKPAAEQVVETQQELEATETLAVEPTEEATVDHAAGMETAVQAAEEVVAEEQALQHPESEQPEPQLETQSEREPETKVVESASESVTEEASDDLTFFEEAAEQQAPKEEKKKGFFGRIRDGLSKTRSGLADGLADLLLGKKEIDDDLLEDLETQLIMADVGMEATQEIMERLTGRITRKELSDSDALFEALIEELRTMLDVAQQPLVVDSEKTPYVILMVGINGVGKTTTIGKLAKQFQNRGKSVMLAAGDTFRAAAVEQLQVWGERNDVPVVAQHTGADSASVIFDAVEAAKSRNVDILIADTAGRLHTKDNLMQELEKVVRVMKKLDDTAPHEVMLVLDAGTGQNAINQCKQFLQAVGVTGLTLTKLDGTAKGGIIFALAKQFEIPVRFIGVGEGIDDLRPFNADEFTRALFKQD
ncbi:signal recognition particle-docking protein FtsY [Bacterioplanoides sp. SCSIO 12839]|uniref:signal recognition particle-docking protein FtsY n=1 Tax=Bacterioplanoides sp. SCSIO 12839 TaxID=2829569 RepID=UPI0021073FCA|nr:signal recognition particle-docking protein FtsY [Bacterioplanoides sp. SCSIO 12839]UTW48432.1 signal recognition particle-docking protein FtsY [Bacterioplanoides sp. SCSIO 12839]